MLSKNFIDILLAEPRCSTGFYILLPPLSPGSWSSPVVLRFLWQQWPWLVSCPDPPWPYPPRTAGGGSGGRCWPVMSLRRRSHCRRSCHSVLQAALCSSCRPKVMNTYFYLYWPLHILYQNVTSYNYWLLMRLM